MTRGFSLGSFPAIAGSVLVPSRSSHDSFCNRTAVTGVTYLREKPDLILMHDDSTIAVLDKEKDMPEPSAKVIIKCTCSRIF